MSQFRVFDNADLAGTSPVGEITVAADGGITQNLDPQSPLAEKLRQALAAISAAKVLPGRSEEEVGEGDQRRRIMKIREVAPGHHAYPSALIGVLAGTYGLRCVVLEEDADEGWQSC